MWAPSARGERSSRSDHGDIRGCRPAVSTRGREVAGCDALHTWLQGDHDKPRCKQGQTHLNNLKNLCTPDNKHKSDGPPMAEEAGRGIKDPIEPGRRPKYDRPALPL
ncbi:MAG: hypothetical protein ACI81L_001900 [Verrucomicrobiales bacterium]|jgi:hypothetical protein